MYADSPNIRGNIGKRNSNCLLCFLEQMHTRHTELRTIGKVAAVISMFIIMWKVRTFVDVELPKEKVDWTVRPRFCKFQADKMPGSFAK